MTAKNVIVFDMDGVLIDVSKSYRETVRQTARLFFMPAPSFDQLPEPLFPLADLAAVKQTGGLNNDWDLSCLIISLLFSRIELPPVNESKDPWERYQETTSRCDLRVLSDFLRSNPTPLSTLLQEKGKPKNDFISGLYTGDVGSGNIIKQIFQEVYLGNDLFTDTYKMAPQFYHEDGLIHREQLLIERCLLEELAGNHWLAIATGRPRAEADYPLNHFDLGKYFTKVMALEDCLEEEERVLKTEGRTVSLSKPHPYMLDALVEQISGPAAECYYIGDMPDDMAAAKRSASCYKGIGMLLSAPDKARLKKDLIKAGADIVIENFKQLKHFLESENI
jgi:HAD superfamily hydrolase (TIGR01548 family)